MLSSKVLVTFLHLRCRLSNLLAGIQTALSKKYRLFRRAFFPRRVIRALACEFYARTLARAQALYSFIIITSFVMYFKLNPFKRSILSSSSVAPRTVLALVSGPLRKFVPHSTLVRRATLEDRPVDAGQLVTPAYDSEETIRSGLVNPFTDPNLGGLERFETLHSLGLEALAAAEYAGLNDAPAPKPADASDAADAGENGAQ